MTNFEGWGRTAHKKVISYANSAHNGETLTSKVEGNSVGSLRDPVETRTISSDRLVVITTYNTPSPSEEGDGIVHALRNKGLTCFT